LKVSIITPSFNSVNTIGLTIDSVKSQTYSNIEHIIVDGGSSDGTYELLNSRRIEFKTLIHEKDRGIYDAINKGVRASTGDLIGVLNSDDFFFNSHVIKKIVDTFQSMQEINCVYGNLIYIDKYSKVKRVWHSIDFSPGLFDKSWTPAHPTFYCRRVVYDELGNYKSDYKIAADVDFMFRALEIKRYRSFHLNEYLVKMLIGGASNQGLKSTIIITREMKKSYQENKRDFNIIKYLFFKLLKLKELKLFS
jgi:glycosyltransferase involved in cell wall biosynthesis